MEDAAHQILGMRRDGLIAEVRRLDCVKRDRIRAVTADPNFDPFSRTIDARVVRLVGQQEALIGQIREIDQLLSADLPH